MDIEAEVARLQKHKDRNDRSPSAEHQRRMLKAWPMKRDILAARDWLKKNWLASRMSDIDPKNHEEVVRQFERHFGPPEGDEVIS